MNNVLGFLEAKLMPLAAKTAQQRHLCAIRGAYVSFMCGAANVLGLMLTVAELGLPVRIMGVLALAENAIGPDAMIKPPSATS